MEKQTFNQISEQESRSYRRQDGRLPSVLIERTDGRITVGNLDKHTGNVLFTEDGRDLYKPNVPVELLTDEHQAKLAAALAGTAVRSLETVSSNSYDNLLNGDIDLKPVDVEAAAVRPPAEDPLTIARRQADAEDGANKAYARAKAGYN